MSASGQHDLADIIGMTYEAAAGGGHWSELGNVLCRALGAGRITLRRMDGAMENIFASGPNPYDDEYRAHYHRLDPLRQAAAKLPKLPGPEKGSPPPLLGQQVVSEAEMLASAYYNEFARRNGQFYALIAMAGGPSGLPMAVHRARGEGSFGPTEVAVLEALLPHLGRALSLEKRMRPVMQSAELTLALLNSLPQAVVLVDEALRIAFVNAAAERMVTSPDCGLTFSHAGVQRLADGRHLRALHRGDDAVLRRLVGEVATQGSAGGALKLRGPLELDSQSSRFAALVYPLPGRVLGREEAAPVPGRAMILLCRLSEAVSLRPDLLSDLFALTRSEAAVALALAGGATAEDVARQRGVSLATVRSQVRALLDKTEAGNLRDFERLIGSLSQAVIAV